VNPDRSGLAAAQGEETEAVSSTHSEADDDIIYPETPSVIRPIRPVFPPEYRIEEHMTRLDVEHSCSYSGSCLSLIQSVRLVFKKVYQILLIKSEQNFEKY